MFLDLSIAGAAEEFVSVMYEDYHILIIIGSVG